MSLVATTTLSSKGQVVIPEEVRKRLGLKSGMHFVVVGEGNTVVLKGVEEPKISEFSDLLASARRAARRAGMQPRDIQSAIRSVRKAQ